jgi:cephalosporin hydroxylase
LARELPQRLKHLWRTARTHRLVMVPKSPAPYLRPGVLDSQDQSPQAYHLWYYHNKIWESTSWQGVPTLKSVSDMWNYQEILVELRPRLVVEFGTANGGSALFFASVLDGLGADYHILTVDTYAARIDDRVKTHQHIETLAASSTDPATGQRIAELRRGYPGPVFAILDSDHSAQHVRAELELITPLLTSGDYVVVEDSNLNGHPVMPDYGPGPYEAVSGFLRDHPDSYSIDRAREAKFGFTFAPNGFLIRQ